LQREIQQWKLSGNKKDLLYYFICLAFIGVFLSLLVYKGSFYFLFVPVILLIVYLALFSLDNLMLLVVFFTPLSINLYNVPGISLGQIGVGMAIPTEPIMFGIMLLFFLHLTYEGFDTRILKHPLSIVILCSLLWTFITAITSTMQFVSFKHLIEKSWGIITFYFLGFYLFKEKKNIYRFLWLYIVSFAIVITYTTIRQYGAHFSEKEAHMAVNPFYNDHTAYGALLAMFIPVIFVLMINPAGKVKFLKFPVFILLLYFTLALFLSYSRAAWVSLLCSVLLLPFLWLKIKPRTYFIILCAIIAGFFIFKTQIILKLQKNRQEVSQRLSNEIQSISNISTDASNLERLNRWHCAYRMFLDKPVFGFGPGTYMFKYAPYQLAADKTIISTDLGNGGNAHSEYLGPLSEEGLLGFVLMVLLAAAIFLTGLRLNSLKNISKEDKLLSLGVLLGLITYLIHGMMNNFLDTDKAAVPFWGFVAILASIDLKYRLKGAAGTEATANVSETGNLTA
jgi:O-antigen ligase